MKPRITMKMTSNFSRKMVAAGPIFTMDVKANPEAAMFVRPRIMPPFQLLPMSEKNFRFPEKTPEMKIMAEANRNQSGMSVSWPTNCMRYFVETANVEFVRLANNPATTPF